MLPLIENYIYLKYLKKLTVDDLRSYYESKWIESSEWNSSNVFFNIEWDKN